MQPINTHSGGVVALHLPGSNILHPYLDTKAALGIRLLTTDEGGPFNLEGSKNERGLYLWVPDKLNPASVTREIGFSIKV